MVTIFEITEALTGVTREDAITTKQLVARLKVEPAEQAKVYKALNVLAPGFAGCRKGDGLNKFGSRPNLWFNPGGAGAIAPTDTIDWRSRYMHATKTIEILEKRLSVYEDLETGEVKF